MRIDDLNRTPLAPGAEKTDQAGDTDKHHEGKVILQDAGHRRGLVFAAVIGVRRFDNWNCSEA